MTDGLGLSAKNLARPLTPSRTIILDRVAQLLCRRALSNPNMLTWPAQFYAMIGLANLMRREWRSQKLGIK